ncbi:MAG: hypothetical protein ACRD7E_01255 [Bryobacteraceae bacterium]
MFELQPLRALPASDPVYQNLLRTQAEDGSRFVRTRAIGFQPYFETGFPHGKSQFISVAATSWAAIALAAAVEEPGAVEKPAE